LTSQHDEIRVFAGAVDGLTAENIEFLRRDVAQFDSRRSWKHLAKTAAILWCATGEVVEPSLFKGDLPKGASGANRDQQRRNEYWKKLSNSQQKATQRWLRVLKPLRNRDSHAIPEDDDLIRLYRLVSELLGKNYVAPKRGERATSAAEGPAELILTGYEAMCVKAGLLEALCALLEDARAREIWRS